MTTESNQHPDDPLEHRSVTGPESGTPETPAEQSGTVGGSRRWIVAAVAVVLLAYPVGRWMLGPAAGTAATRPAAATNELQLSFQHYQAGRYQEAIAAAKAALAANPNSADAYNNLAVSYLALRMYDEGIQAAQNAIRLMPDYQLAKNNLAWIQQEKANALSPIPVAQIAQAATLLNQSVQHYQAGRFKECIDTATQAAKLNPNSARAFNNIGVCAGNLQLWDDAIRNTQEALRLDPNFQLAKNNLAWVQQERLKTAGSGPK